MKVRLLGPVSAQAGEAWRSVAARQFLCLLSLVRALLSKLGGIAKLTKYFVPVCGLAAPLEILNPRGVLYNFANETCQSLSTVSDVLARDMNCSVEGRRDSLLWLQISIAIFRQID